MTVMDVSYVPLHWTSERTSLHSSQAAFNTVVWTAALGYKLALATTLQRGSADGGARLLTILADQEGRSGYSNPSDRSQSLLTANAPSNGQASIAHKSLWTALVPLSFDRSPSTYEATST